MTEETKMMTVNTLSQIHTKCDHCQTEVWFTPNQNNIGYCPKCNNAIYYGNLCQKSL